MIEIIKKWSILVLDIETSGLRADYAHVICAVAWDYNTGKIKTFRIDAYPEHPSMPDKYLVEEIIEHVNKYDVLVTWNGTNFDKKFLNTRAFLNGSRKMIKAIANRDIIYFARHRLLVASRKIKFVGEIVLGKSTKTFTTPKIWFALMRGKKWAIDKMVHHCRCDVRDTARLYKRFLPYLSQDLKKK
mgnify:FL=1